jgi:hypothetical protein
VIAPADDLAVVAVAAQLANATDSTLLLHSPESSAIINAELTRLRPDRMTLVELDEDWLADHSAEIVRMDGLLTNLGDVARRAAGSIARVGMVGTGPDTIAAVLRSIVDGRTTTVPTRQSGVCDPDSQSANEAIEDAADGRTAFGEVWLVEICSPGLALLAASSLGSEGTVLLVDGRDLRRGRHLVDAVHAAPSGISRIHVAGEISEDADWQLATLLAGDELPSTATRRPDSSASSVSKASKKPLNAPVRWRSRTVPMGSKSCRDSRSLHRWLPSVRAATATTRMR